jgi:site-specific recombinase XerD
MAEQYERDAEQLSFFEDVGIGESRKPMPPLPKGTVVLNPDSSLELAVGAFKSYMRDRGFTAHTQQAFSQDMLILRDYLEPAKSIGDISTATLNAFLRWMERERGVPCRPKTMERRITTLKVFFGWLAEEGYLTRDVAAPLIHREASGAIPDVLNNDEIAKVMEITQAIRRGDDAGKPDARPHLLFLLVLNAGIKKNECVEINLNHLDIVDDEKFALWIRYRNPQRRHKERCIQLPPTLIPVLAEYLQQYKPDEKLFPWTARNLEYVLTHVGRTAGLKRLSFEMLRWTCAVRDYAEGMDPQKLRNKLGLSQISWYEVEAKLALLTQHGR